MTRRRRTKSRTVRLARRCVGFCRQLLRLAAACCWSLALRLWRHFRRPTVIIDARRRQARKLRREIARAARTYAHALGVELPAGLLVVVQRVVHEGRQLNGLLQAFDAPDGDRRYVIHLALSVNGRAVSDDELLAALRHQLTRALEDVIGKPVLSVPLELELPRVRAGASVVELRPDARERQDGRRAMPIERIEDDQAS